MIDFSNSKVEIKSLFAGSLNGNEILFFRLSVGTLSVVICNYGCTIVSIEFPDRKGIKKNVVAGFDTLAEYQIDQNYIGRTIGRYANRIALGKFKINGEQFQMECENASNHLHGCVNDFHKKVWRSEINNDGLTLHYLSKNSEEGYPCNLNVAVRFSFEDRNKFVIQYTATTDKPTIVNLSNHSYFNLTGFDSPNIYNHLLKINSKKYTVKNEKNIPSGGIMPVFNTPYDFRKSKFIGKDIDALGIDMGCDINFVLDDNQYQNEPAAQLYELETGRLVRIFTSEPGLQIYTANWWDGSIKGAQNKFYHKHGAIAFETQAFPDAPNHAYFPNTILRPSEAYHSSTAFQFLTV